MYVIIAGAGKVGWNLARELIGKDREVTLIESNHHRFRVVVRVADPGRAAWYAEQGLHTISPTQAAIDQATRIALAT